MDFATKLAQTRAYTTENQNGVDAQEVYDEAILQAIELTNPGSNTPQVVESGIITAGSGVITGGTYYSISFTFSSDFTGIWQSNSQIAGNTVINLTAKTTLGDINYTVTTGSILIVAIAN